MIQLSSPDIRFELPIPCSRIELSEPIAKCAYLFGGELLYLVLDAFQPAHDLNPRITHPPVGFRHSFFSISRFLNSSPSSSTGVSRINALFRSFGWLRMRRNPSSPMEPRPICWCRSTCDPSGVFESLA